MYEVISTESKKQSTECNDVHITAMLDFIKDNKNVENEILGF